MKIKNIIAITNTKYWHKLALMAYLVFSMGYAATNNMIHSNYEKSKDPVSFAHLCFNTSINQDLKSYNQVSCNEIIRGNMILGAISLPIRWSDGLGRIILKLNNLLILSGVAVLHEILVMPANDTVKR